MKPDDRNPTQILAEMLNALPARKPPPAQRPAQVRQGRNQRVQQFVTNTGANNWKAARKRLKRERAQQRLAVRSTNPQEI